ncbi:uncharacterized protein [Phyllobates terribilis]|uniref:uncharacterized protein n=1 Tax=Phyllobates terribilis TaxID=111132 RepID=UPI003CCB5FBA
MSFILPGDSVDWIFCTYCVHSPVPALMFCLVCEASLCDGHLTAHSDSEEHVFLDHVWSQEKVLETCLTGDTVESQILSQKLTNALQKLISNREKKERRLCSLQERRRKIQETAMGTTEKTGLLFGDIRRHLVDLEQRVFSEISRREDQALLSVSDQIQQLELETDELSRKIRHIEALHPQMVLQDPVGEAGGDLGCDANDLDEDLLLDTLCQGLSDVAMSLRRSFRSWESSAKSLDDTNDPRMVLQDPVGEAGGDLDCDANDLDEDLLLGTLCEGLSDVAMSLRRSFRSWESSAISLDDTNDPWMVLQDPVGEAGGNLDCDADDLDEDLLLDTLCEGLSDVAMSLRRNHRSWERSDMLLDVNTAANNLYITPCLTQVSATSREQNRLETQVRFRFNQVFSSCSFSSGRHYWDVETHVTGEWRVGASYYNLDREGDQAYMGSKSKSWCLWGYYNNYYVSHDGIHTYLPIRLSSYRFRIFLDYEAGQLSFYEVGDTMRHLHTDLPPSPIRHLHRSAPCCLLCVREQLDFGQTLGTAWLNRQSSN